VKPFEKMQSPSRASPSKSAGANVATVVFQTQVWWQCLASAWLLDVLSHNLPQKFGKRNWLNTLRLPLNADDFLFPSATLLAGSESWPPRSCERLPRQMRQACDARTRMNLADGKNGRTGRCPCSGPGTQSKDQQHSSRRQTKRRVRDRNTTVECIRTPEGDQNSRRRQPILLLTCAVVERPKSAAAVQPRKNLTLL
jgi:hypothetical protein